MTRRTGHLFAGFAAFALTAAGAADARAQSDGPRLLTIRPAVLLEEDPAFGVRITSEIRRDRILVGRYPRSWHVSARVDAPVFIDRDRNPETMRAHVDVGGLLSLFRPSTAAGPVPTPEDEPAWDRGFLAARLTVGGEAPQDLTTADVTVGGGVEYGHGQYHELWFVPEARVGWDVVFCVECDFGVDGANETGSRLDGEIGWSIPADNWIGGPLAPLWLRLRGRGFVTSGLDDAEPRRGDDGLWGSAELAYRCDACGPVHEVYVRGHTGRLPLQLRDERAVTLGLALWW